MIEFVGSIKQVRFYSEDSKFIVALIYVDELEKHLWITGNMIQYDENLKYRFFGDYMIHPKYGQQFKFERYEEVAASGYNELIDYLSSTSFKGIGKVQATHIVETLGEDAIVLIKEDINVLDQVIGMNDLKKNVINEVINKQGYKQEIIQVLMKYAVPQKIIEKIIETYQEKTLETINQAPYQLLEDIEGVPFKVVDKIAQNVGIVKDDMSRLEAIVYYMLKEMCYQGGHTYILFDDLTRKLTTFDRLIDFSLYSEAIDNLIKKEKLILENDRIMVDLYDESEKTIATSIKSFLQLQDRNYPSELINNYINDIENRDFIKFDEIQKEAINAFVSTKFMVLTGGPGTGKTTIVKAAIEVYQKLEEEGKIALVAPTGRAAKRLNELTGLDTHTIHRLLKWDVQSNEFIHNSSNPIEYSLLIIDEFSMVDTVLFARLLEASKYVQKILIIGDHEQLPSVSPGDVLRDILKIPAVTIVKLNNVYRQMQDSGIIKVAHQIRNNNIENEIDFSIYSDINFVNSDNAHVLPITKKIVEKAMSEGYTIQDIQVLAPMYQGIAGIDALNTMLQDVINPDDAFKNSIQIGTKKFREGDKLLQLKNRVEDNVFNGDIGILVEVRLKDNFETLTDTIVVDFDGIIIEYTANDFNQLTLAYCMSIHKAQGSEFKIVIMPVLRDYYVMLQKRILYTGITRAKQSLFLVGEKDALYLGISNYLDKERYTNLNNYFMQDDEISPYNFM